MKNSWHLLTATCCQGPGPIVYNYRSVPSFKEILLKLGAIVSTDDRAVLTVIVGVHYYRYIVKLRAYLFTLLHGCFTSQGGHTAIRINYFKGSLIYTAVLFSTDVNVQFSAVLNLIILTSAAFLVLAKKAGRENRKPALCPNSELSSQLRKRLVCPRPSCSRVCLIKQLFWIIFRV